MKAIEKFGDLVGETLRSVRQDGNDEIRIELEDGREFRLHHMQDCCESVAIEDVNGDLADLVGEVVVAEGSSNSDEPKPEEYPDDSFTWTFYRLGTQRGTVVIRWYGASNGYYSESVDFDAV